MIRLRQTHGADVGREIELDRELIRVGRMPDSDVRFDAEVDLDASGRHAEIRRAGDQWVLVDAGSRNGTWLNGERVSHAPLKEGDEIEFGMGGPRMVVDEASARSVPKPTARLVSTDMEEAVMVPATDMPGALGAATDVTDPMVTPLFAQHEVAIEFRSEQEGPARDTLRAPGRGYGDWILMGALLVLAAVSVSTIARQDRSPERIPDDVVARVRADASPALWRLRGVSLPCMAFNVGPRLLATTASCVRAVQQAKRSGTEPTAARAEGGELTITRMWRHPDASASGDGPDLGLVEVSANAGQALPIATPEVLAALSLTQPLLVLRDLEILGEVTFDGIEAGDPGVDGGALLRYSGGAMLGAPVLDREGRVVGVHHADDSAIRADTLRAMIAGLAQ